MRDFFSDISPMFGETSGTRFDFSPSMDVVDTDGEIEVSVDLPGMNKDDVDVSVQNDVLTVTGEKKDERTEKEKGYTYYERSFGSFQRRLRFPENVDTENIRAEFDKGVLKLTAPKREVEQPERKKIEVG